METMTWTDEKIDALAKEVYDGFARAEVEYARTDERFKRVDKRFDEVDRRFDEVDRRFDEVGQRFDRVEGDIKSGFARMDAKFDALQRTLIQIGGSLIGVLIVTLATVLVAVLT